MDRPRLPSANRRRIATAILSAAGHLVLLAALFPWRTDPPREPEPEPMVVQLVAPPEPPPPEPPPAPERPAPDKPQPPKPPPPRRNIARLAPPPPQVTPLFAGKPGSADGDSELSDAQVASAGTAESGGAGRPCNMTRRLQTALRKDRLVQAAVAQAHRGKALLVWNGRWIRHGEQEGSGLAAVREAIMWEVGFAPEACRTELMHGMVLLSLDDAPGAARLVVGGGDWRWSDLLFAHRGAPRTATR